MPLRCWREQLTFISGEKKGQKMTKRAWLVEGFTIKLRATNEILSSGLCLWTDFLTEDSKNDRSKPCETYKKAENVEKCDTNMTLVFLIPEVLTAVE